MRWSWLSGWFSWRKKRSHQDLSESDRRDNTRHEVTFESSHRLVAIVEGTSGWVQVRNLSAGGIGLVLDRSFAPDTILSVQLLKRPQMILHKLQVRVTYAMEHPSGEWILGGSFDHRLTTEELQSLLN